MGGQLRLYSLAQPAMLELLLSLAKMSLGGLGSIRLKDVVEVFIANGIFAPLPLVQVGLIKEPELLGLG